MNRYDGLASLRAHNIGNDDGAQQDTGARHEHLGCFRVAGEQTVRPPEAVITHDCPITHQYQLAIHRGVDAATRGVAETTRLLEIGRASCRERGCEYEKIEVGV